MPLICGPLNSRFTYTGNPCPHLDLALQSTAETLRVAVAEYETHFKVKIEPLIEPFDGNPDNFGKYFMVSSILSDSKWIVDIHVIRENKELCPKQNLDFALISEDIVDIGELIC